MVNDVKLLDNGLLSISGNTLNIVCGLQGEALDAFLLKLRKEAELAKVSPAITACRRAATQRRYLRLKDATTEKVDRAAVISRDGGVCYLCGAKPQGRDLTLDHVVPLSRGGSHCPKNLRVACASCNSRKGDKLPGKVSK